MKNNVDLFSHAFDYENLTVKTYRTLLTLSIDIFDVSLRRIFDIPKSRFN